MKDFYPVYIIGNGPGVVLMHELPDEELCWKRGKNLELMEINSRPGNAAGISAKAHSMLTIDAVGVGHPTARVRRRVMEFLRERLGD